MKSVHYIASVISLYRQLLDGPPRLAGQESGEAGRKMSSQDCLKLLSRVKNRGYSAGFMKGAIEVEDYSYEKSQSNSGSTFVGDITDEKTNSGCICFVRNKIFAGETLEVLMPDGSISEITMSNPLKTVEDKLVEFINNPQKIALERKLPSYSILRRVDPAPSVYSNLNV